MTYVEFIENQIANYALGIPIYTLKLAQKLADTYSLPDKEAAAATSVAVKRLMDSKVIPELRFFQKGIYYRTKETPFGDISINKEVLTNDKYLNDDNGYETGLALLYSMGLTSQIPSHKVFATNKAKHCMRQDKVLGVYICPPKIAINRYNKLYLQTLDALEYMEKAPIDAVNPYKLIANHINNNDLEYGELLSLAGKYYSKATILKLAYVAGERN